MDRAMVSGTIDERPIRSGGTNATVQKRSRF